MSTTVSYKGNTIATVSNNTKTLETEGKYLEADIILTDVSQSVPVLETVTKSYTPTESQQTESVTPSVGYDGIAEVDVTVGAISSSYVGSGITRRDSTDLSASGATVTAPAGYYANQATTSVASGSATAPASISATGATASSNGTTITLSKTVSNTPQVSAGYVSSGTAGNSSVSLSATDSNFTAENIKSGVSLFGKIGSYTGGGGTLTVATKTLTNTAVAQTLSFTSLSGQPKYWFLRVTSQVSSSGSTTYYYITDLFYDGTSIKGNTFRIGSTRRIYNITSGITQSYNNGTLTITGGSAVGSQPGQFYGASGIGYELVYIY